MLIGNLHLAIGYLQTTVPHFNFFPLGLLIIYALFTAPLMLHPACASNGETNCHKITNTLCYFLSLLVLFIYTGVMSMDVAHKLFPLIESTPMTLLPKIYPPLPAGLIGLMIIFLGQVAVFDNIFGQPSTSQKPWSLCVLAIVGLVLAWPLYVGVLMYEGLNSLHFFYYIFTLFVLYLYLKYRCQWLGKGLNALGILLSFVGLFSLGVCRLSGGLTSLMPVNKMVDIALIVVPVILLLAYLWKGKNCGKLNAYLGVIGLFALPALALFAWLFQSRDLIIYTFTFYAGLISATYLVLRCCFDYFDGETATQTATKALLATWLYIILAAYFMIEFFIAHPYYEIIRELQYNHPAVTQHISTHYTQKN